MAKTRSAIMHSGFLYDVNYLCVFYGLVFQIIFDQISG
jgi:hypothetical protein